MKCSQFFQEANGQLSATRLAFLAWSFTALAVWGGISVKQQKMQEIPQSVQVLLGVLMTGKVAQKFGEEPSSGSKEDDQSTNSSKSTATQTAVSGRLLAPQQTPAMRLTTPPPQDPARN